MQSYTLTYYRLRKRELLFLIAHGSHLWGGGGGLNFSIRFEHPCLAEVVLNCFVA